MRQTGSSAVLGPGHPLPSANDLYDHACFSTTLSAKGSGLVQLLETSGLSMYPSAA